MLLMDATLLQGWSGLCQGGGVVPGLGSLVVLCGWSIGQLPGVTSNHNHISYLVLSSATTVWLLVVCGWVGGLLGRVIIRQTQFNCYYNCLLELSLAKIRAIQTKINFSLF